ncbi:MAG: nucleotidyltransferase domain-containing protein [Sulfolobus sp.]|nr:nucleotidyltransferase domain-containing protein [Sulfolobus sp.]
MESDIVSAFLEVFGDDLVSIVLYGSYARGEQRRDSDIDLLIVLNEIKDRYEVMQKFLKVEKILDRTLYESLRKRGYDPYVSPYFLDVDSASRFRPLYIDIVFDAKILYDKGDVMKRTFEKVRKRLEELGAKRVKLGNSHYVILTKVRPGEVIVYE